MIACMHYHVLTYQTESNLRFNVIIVDAALISDTHLLYCLRLCSYFAVCHMLTHTDNSIHAGKTTIDTIPECLLLMV
jgi:hypothetical protein